MPGVSPLQRAQRALVSLLLRLAAKYSVELSVNRDSCDKELTAAFRKVARRAHPDKGGTTADTQGLISARDSWEKEKGKQRHPGPKKDMTVTTLVLPQGWAASFSGKRVFRVRSVAVLLTYSTFLAQNWLHFVGYAQSKLAEWRVKFWCATLEHCKSAVLHAHLFLQFFSAVDTPSRQFSYLGTAPNASPNDLCGEGICKKKWQQSVDRGMFYVYADKIGTARDSFGAPVVAGNYFPAWEVEKLSTYDVLGKWPEKLFKQYKLTEECYDDYLFKCRDGVVARKRNLDACREHRVRKEMRQEVAQRTKRLRANPVLFKPWAPVPEAQLWLQSFAQEKDRYPFLLVLGASRAGKTEWAKSLFKKPLQVEVGTLPHFPDSMRAFERGVHDGIVLDDVRDLAFLELHQEKLQGKYDRMVEFASTPGGQLAYALDLWRVPIVVTVNFSTKNLSFLQDAESHDFLSHPDNRTVIVFSGLR